MGDELRAGDGSELTIPHAFPRAGVIHGTELLGATLLGDLATLVVFHAFIHAGVDAAGDRPVGAIIPRAERTTELYAAFAQLLTVAQLYVFAQLQPLGQLHTLAKLYIVAAPELDSVRAATELQPNAQVERHDAPIFAGHHAVTVRDQPAQLRAFLVRHAGSDAVLRAAHGNVPLA